MDIEDFEQEENRAVKSQNIKLNQDHVNGNTAPYKRIPDWP